MKNGTRFSRTFVLKSRGGVPRDISGGTFAMQLRVQATDANPALSLSSPANFQVLDGPNGRLQLMCDVPSATDLPPGKYLYDVLRTDQEDSAGDPEWLFGGTVKVSLPVTRLA
jgi:hypothetical protein